MSADKFQAGREDLANVFNEANLNATGTATTQTSFNRETLSEAFSEPHLIAADPEQSFPRFDHTALTGLFSEPCSEAPSPTSFDQAFAEMLSVRSARSSWTQSPGPVFDQQALAEILSEPRAISANTNPSQPSFDHHLAETLTQSRADPMNSAKSTLSSHTNPLPQCDQGEPAAKAFAVSPPAKAEGARPPPAKSLLAKLHDIFSAKEEPSLTVVERVQSPQSISAQSGDPGVKNCSTLPEAALAHPAGSKLTDLPLGLEQGPISPPISGQQPKISDPIAPSTVDAVGPWLRHASSLPNERACSISTDPKSSSCTDESYSSTPTAVRRLDNVHREAEANGLAAPPEAESPPEQARSALMEAVPPNFNNIEPVLSKSGEVRLDPLLPASLNIDDVKVAEGPNVAEEPYAEKALQPLAEPASLICSIPVGSRGSKAVSPQPILSLQSDNLVPAEDIVSAAAPSEAENAGSQLPLEELAPSVYIEPPPIVRTEPPSDRFFGQSKDMTSVVSPVAPSPPTDVESAQQQRSGMLAELPRTISTDLAPPLSESLSPASSSTESHSSIFENRASPTPPSGGRAAVEHSVALPLTDLPAPISTETGSSGSSYERNAPPSWSLHESGSVEPPAKSSFADSNEAEGAHVRPLLTALHVLNTIPSPQSLEKNLRSASSPASQPDNGDMSLETITLPTVAEVALAQPPRSLTPEMRSAVSTNATFLTPVFENERWRPSVSDQPASEVPAAQPAPVALSADTQSAVTREQHAKSLLDQLDLNVAIHLRWTMRDIRSKRTKFLPVSDNDLEALMNIGLVEMRDGLPRLTGLGLLALDQASRAFPA